MRNVLITGGSGQLGRALMEVAAATDGSTCRYIALTHHEADITNERCIEELIKRYNAYALINCAAYTDVERAEDEPEVARRINGEAAAMLARLCKKHQVRLLHISTDYVFGGDTSRSTPYTAEDTVAPLNSYGRSKAEGEAAVVGSGGVVLRTAWLYSPWGRNFCTTILRLLRTNDELCVVDDQRGTPTSALSLARNILSLMERRTIESMSGIYHLTDGGEGTWYDFAMEITRLSGAKCRVLPCTSAERNTKAARPHYSVLDKRKTLQIEGITMVSWQQTLRECIERINKQQ